MVHGARNSWDLGYRSELEALNHGCGNFVYHPTLSRPEPREQWRGHRNPRLLCPARGRDGRAAATATTPMAKSSVQGAFRHAKRAAGIHKRAVSIHTLRHNAGSRIMPGGIADRPRMGGSLAV
ncbi:MAG: hypothetical protein HY705_04385 [Gemmatimonadetes bacterium]|nr:hypothetical protein [Gemmatimonadota bacterium]